MSYRDKVYESLTPEMIRVAREWHNGSKTILYEIGEKDYLPIAVKEYEQIVKEVDEVFLEIKTEDRTKYAKDIEAFYNLIAWANRQRHRRKQLLKLRLSIFSAFGTGLTTGELKRYVDAVIEEWKLPTD